MHSVAMLTAMLDCDWMNLSKASAGKKVNLRLFEFLAVYKSVVWAPQMEAGGVNNNSHQSTTSLHQWWLNHTVAHDYELKLSTLKMDDP